MAITRITIAGVLTLCWNCTCSVTVECICTKKIEVDNYIEDERIIKTISTDLCGEHKNCIINNTFLIKEIEKALELYKTNITDLLYHYHVIYFPHQLTNGKIILSFADRKTPSVREGQKLASATE